MLFSYLLAQAAKLHARAHAIAALLPALLAQAPVITQDATISLPVAVTLLAGAAIIIESRVKIARMESDLEKTTAKADAALLQASTQTAILGEIKAGVEQLRSDFRSQRGAA